MYISSYNLAIIALVILSVSCYLTIFIKKKTNKFIDVICFTIIPGIIFVLLVCIFGYYLFVINTWLFQSKNDGFAGNFIGGVIGGIVALLVAKYQIKLSISKAKDSEKKQFYAYIISFKSEIKYNHELLKRLIATTKDKCTNIHPNNSIPFATEIWDVIKLSSIFIEKVSEELYTSLSNLYYELSILKNSDIIINEKSLKESYCSIEMLLNKIKELR